MKRTATIRGSRKELYMKTKSKQMKILIVSLIVFSLLTALASCSYQTDYTYLHDKSEISSIEIVNAYYDSENDEGVQVTLVVIANISKFIEEFEKLNCHITVPGGPVGVVEEGIAIKIIYENGDYEVLRYMGRSEYTQELGYDVYCDRASFDKNEFHNFVASSLGDIEYEIKNNNMLVK